MNNFIEFLNSELFNNITDVTICSMSVILTGILYKLMQMLKEEKELYSFGSKEWWTWLKFIAIIAFSTIGSIGLSIVTFLHSLQKNHSEELTESLADVFLICILLAMILQVIHFINKEKEILRSTDIKVIE